MLAVSHNVVVQNVLDYIVSGIFTNVEVISKDTWFLVFLVLFFKKLFFLIFFFFFKQKTAYEM